MGGWAVAREGGGGNVFGCAKIEFKMRENGYSAPSSPDGLTVYWRVYYALFYHFLTLEQLHVTNYKEKPYLNIKVREKTS